METILFNSYRETIEHSKNNNKNDNLVFYGSQLFERKIAWEYIKTQKDITDVYFTSFSGTDRYDLTYKRNGISRIVEIKFRYVNSDRYPSSMCEKDKFFFLNEEGIRRNSISEYWNIFLDGVIKIYDFRYVVKQEVNLTRDASDSYFTNNKKNYPTFLLTEDNVYTNKFRNRISIEEINNFAKKEMTKRGYNIPLDFKINKG